MKRIAIIAATIVIVLCVTLVVVRQALEMRERSEKAHYRAETEATEAKVKSRQITDETSGAVTVDLKPFINTALTDSPSSPKGITADNLAELPKGTNIYAGVPFDVEGSIQLMGGRFKQYKKHYPIKVEKIPIGRSCANLYIFHGTIDVPWEMHDKPVATLILHYTDGGTEELNFIANKQAFDFWGPAGKYGLKKTGEIKPTSDTELAWVGTNPWIQKWVPQFRLRLYKTTFVNPRRQK